MNPFVNSSEVDSFSDFLAPAMNRHWLLLSQIQVKYDGKPPRAILLRKESSRKKFSPFSHLPQHYLPDHSSAKVFVHAMSDSNKAGNGHSLPGVYQAFHKNIEL